MMDRMDFNEAFEQIAADRGVPTDVLRAQVDAAIHEAFMRDDTEVKKWFHDRFGDREPTLEELVEAIAKQMGDKKPQPELRWLMAYFFGFALFAFDQAE